MPCVTRANRGETLLLKGAFNPKDTEAIQHSGQRLVTKFVLISSSGRKPESVGRETVICTQHRNIGEIDLEVIMQKKPNAGKYLPFFLGLVLFS